MYIYIYMYIRMKNTCVYTYTKGLCEVTGCDTFDISSRIWGTAAQTSVMGHTSI